QRMARKGIEVVPPGDLRKPVGQYFHRGVITQVNAEVRLLHPLPHEVGRPWQVVPEVVAVVPPRVVAVYAVMASVGSDAQDLVESWMMRRLLDEELIDVMFLTHSYFTCVTIQITH